MEGVLRAGAPTSFMQSIEQISFVFIYVSVEGPFWCGATRRVFSDVARYVSNQPGFVGYFFYAGRRFGVLHVFLADYCDKMRKSD